MSQFEILLESAVKSDKTNEWFEKQLLKTKFLILTAKDERIGKEGSFFQARRNFDFYIKYMRDYNDIIFTPVFASEDAVPDAFKEDYVLKEFIGDDLLRILRPMSIVINPFSKYSKIIMVDDVNRMLGWNPFKHQYKRSFAGMECYIGEVQNNKAYLKNKLCDFFDRKSYVREAYLCEYFIPSRFVSSHVLLHVKTDFDLNLTSSRIQDFLDSMKYLPQEVDVFVSKKVSPVVYRFRPFYLKGGFLFSFSREKICKFILCVILISLIALCHHLGNMSASDKAPPLVKNTMLN